MNPATATFLTMDPVRGVVGERSVRWNPYPYVGGNPINYTDPTGQFFEIASVGGGAAKVAAAVGGAGALKVAVVTGGVAVVAIGGYLAYRQLQQAADTFCALNPTKPICQGATPWENLCEIADNISVDPQMLRRLSLQSGTSVVGGFLVLAASMVRSGTRVETRERAEDDERYYFRGTTVGFPGNRSVQIAGVSPTSTQPTVATVFATVAETEHGGDGVVYIASSRDLAGIPIGQGNNFIYEFEVVFEILPLDFAQLASISVSAAGARSILASMGIPISDRISLSEQSGLLESMITMALSEPQVHQFVSLARVTP